VSKFDDWWNSNENPVRDTPESTRIQMKPFLREAFNAGKEAWRKSPNTALPKSDQFAGGIGEQRIEYATSDGGDVP
jgi:hypothetical protein